MNGTSSAQQGIQQPVEQQPLPKEKKVRLLEISFIISIALVLLLGILNYFNILKLSQLFPRQIGWLPHILQNKPQLQSNSPLKSIPTPASNYSPNTFKYDTEKAKTIISQYIKDTIKPDFIPENLDIKQGLSIDNRVEDNKRQFGSYFTVSQATFSINFHFKENANTPNDFSMFIEPTKTEKATLTPSLANSLVASYFNNPYSPITNCDTKGTTSYCEIFKIENDGKRGFGTVITQNPSKSPSNLTSIVFTCFIPKESKDYDKLKSCISP